MGDEITITGGLPEVCISSQWYQLAKEFVQILAVDTTTPEEVNIHKMASYLQECFDAGKKKGEDEISNKVIQNLFK